MNRIKIYDVREQPGDSAFLLDNGTTAIMYDSGFAFTGYKVADKIKTILGNRNLDFIFLTHSHYDHALGSAYAKKYWPDAKVVAGEYAAKIFSKPTAKAVMRDLDRKFAETCGITDYEDLIDELCVDIPVSDGDEIIAGDMKFTAINLPGHTRCSVGYYCKEENLLLCSESIGVWNGEDDVVPSYLVGYSLSMDSIAKVEKINPESILVPHFGILTGEKAKLYLSRARISAAETTDEIANMIKQGKTKDEIISFFKEKFYRGYVITIYPIAAMELNTSIMIDLITREIVERM